VRFERSVLFALFAFGAVLFAGTFWIRHGEGGGAADVGSRFAPQLFSGALMLFSVLALIFRPQGEEHKLSADAVVWFIMIVVVGYALALPVLGYIASTFTTLMLVLIAVRAGAWWSITLFSASMTGILYLIFERVMLVGLPAGPWRL
jgi:hypothetical protein